MDLSYMTEIGMEIWFTVPNFIGNPLDVTGAGDSVLAAMAV